MFDCTTIPTKDGKQSSVRNLWVDIFDPVTSQGEKVEFINALRNGIEKVPAAGAEADGVFSEQVFSRLPDETAMAAVVMSRGYRTALHAFRYLPEVCPPEHVLFLGYSVPNSGRKYPKKAFSNGKAMEGQVYALKETVGIIENNPDLSIIFIDDLIKTGATVDTLIVSARLLGHRGKAYVLSERCLSPDRQSLSYTRQLMTYCEFQGYLHESQKENWTIRRPTSVMTEAGESIPLDWSGDIAHAGAIAINADAAGSNPNRESESIAKKYKHIIFDFGGVFLDLEGKRTGVPGDLARIFNITEDEASEVWEDSKEKLLTGQETPREFLAATAKKLDAPIDLKNSYNEWRSLDMAGKEQRIDWKLLEYAERLKKHYAIHILTNMIDLDQESGGWTREFDSHFENVFKSYEEKLRKPDKEAFLNVLRKINAKPEECVLVDDSLTNTRVAEELGLKCVRFTTLEALNDEFKKLGVV